MYKAENPYIIKFITKNMKISFEKYFLKQQSPGLSQQHQEILGQQSNQAESQMANNQLQQSHHPITPQQPNTQIYSNVIPFTGHSGKFNQKRNHIPSWYITKS